MTHEIDLNQAPPKLLNPRYVLPRNLVLKFIFIGSYIWLNFPQKAKKYSVGFLSD